MNSSRVQGCRLIDYSTVTSFDGAQALQREIVRFIKGIRGPRENLVTKKQIVAWFRATPAKFVEQNLHQILADDKVRLYGKHLGSFRHPKGAYVYEVVEKPAEGAQA